jgi:glycosyltransferase involved in cell wall biosynthesis
MGAPDTGQGRRARALRIAYVFPRPLPSRDTDTLQVAKTVDALARAGAAVDLVVPPAASGGDEAALEHELRAFYAVDAPFGVRVVTGVRAGDLELPDHVRARIARFMPGRYLGPIEAARPVHGVAGSVFARRHGYDLVYTRSRTAVVTCLLLGQKVVLEAYRRFGHETPSFVRALSLAARRGRLLGLITHSDAARESFLSASFPPERARTLVNGYDPADWRRRPSRAEARAELGLSESRPLVVYTGHVGPRKGMPILLELAARVPEADFAIVGGNPGEVQTLERDAAARGLANLRCFGFRPARELPPFLLAADVLFIPPTGAPLERHGRTVLPMKIFSYLAAGRPILAGRLPDVAEVLIDGDNARLVTPDAPHEAARALRELLGDHALAERLSRGALHSAASLTWDDRGVRLLEQLERWVADMAGT